MGQMLENAVFWTWHSYQIYELSSCGYFTFTRPTQVKDSHPAEVREMLSRLHSLLRSYLSLIEIWVLFTPFNACLQWHLTFHYTPTSMGNYWIPKAPRWRQGTKILNIWAFGDYPKVKLWYNLIHTFITEAYFLILVHMVLYKEKILKSFA